MDNGAIKYRRSIFLRILILLVPLFLLPFVLDGSAYFVLGIGLSAASYFLLFRNQLWCLLVLSPVSLSLGSIMNIPVSNDWVYEARLAEIFLLLAAFLYLLDFYFGRRPICLRFDYLSGLLASYILLSLASILYVIDLRLFVFGLKVAVFSFLAYFLVRELIDTPRKLYAMLSGFGLAALVLSAQLFYKFYEVGFSSKFFFERNTILMPIGPLATGAAVIALLVPISLAFFFASKKRNLGQLVAFSGAVLGSTAVFLSLGKGAIASLFIGLSYLFYRLRHSRLPISLMALWFIFLSYVLLNPFIDGLFTRLKNTFIDENTRYRFLELATSWGIIVEHPLLGVGSGQQLYYFKEILDYETAQLINNFFVQAQVDLGVFGLFLVFLIIFAIMKLGKKSDPGGFSGLLTFGFIASFIVAFFNGLVEVTFFALPYAIVFWLMAGVYSINNLQLRIKN